MAIKPPDLLNRLPSVTELLEKPPIRALADRWNRSVVAGGVRSFLDELKNDLRRRAADVQLPSMRELAERAARYIVSRQHQQLGTAINATGRIWGAPWMSRPLPDAALERAMAVGREFVVESPAAAAQKADVEAVLCQLTGAQAAIVVHGYAGALWLALSSLAADRGVLVARAEVGDVGPGEPLPQLIAAAHCHLCEVGTTNRALAADYEAAASPRAAVVLTISPDEYRVVGHTAAADIGELVALCRERDLRLIAALGTAPLAEAPAALNWPQRSVIASISAGADLVVVRGDGLVGGPPCGIFLGNREVIARVAQHPLFAAWSLDEFRAAALAAALAAHQDSDRGLENLPAWQLLTTPLENLRNRAERLAPQLAQSADVESAAAVETRSPISAAIAPDGSMISYGVALTPRTSVAADLDKRFRCLPVPVIGRIEGDRLILDLRTVLPRQDRTLVEAIVGSSSPEQSAVTESQSRGPSGPQF